MVPAIKQEVACQRPQVLKKVCRAARACRTRWYFGSTHPVLYGTETLEIQCESHSRQMLFAMAVVMFEMIAFGVQGLVVLVLNVPAAHPGCTTDSTLV